MLNYFIIASIALAIGAGIGAFIHEICTSHEVGWRDRRISLMADTMHANRIRLGELAGQSAAWQKQLESRSEVLRKVHQLLDGSKQPHAWAGAIEEAKNLIGETLPATDEVGTL